MFGEPSTKHFIKNAFDEDGKGLASLCFADVFRMIERGHAISGKQRHLERN